MVNPTLTPSLLIEECVTDIDALILANAHEGPHPTALHDTRVTPPRAGLVNCPRCRLIVLAKRLATMCTDLDDTVVLAHLPKSARDATFERLRAERDFERANP